MRHSAGLLMYKIVDDEIKIYLVHPGGPYYKNKDNGVWTIPKGEIKDNEDAICTAIREFVEEIGISRMSFSFYLTQNIHEPDYNGFIPLECIRLKSGKLVHIWAFEGDFLSDGELKGNMFEMEWPPKSGKKQQFPEVDHGQFFSIVDAKKKIYPSQVEFIDRLVDILQRTKNI